MKAIYYIALLSTSILLHAQWGLLKEKYVAGENISIALPSTDPIQLTVSHSYGITLLEGEKKEDQTIFAIPEVIRNKKGIIQLKALKDGRVIWKKQITIVANAEGEKSIEAYCGPKHLVVNKGDFSMVTASVLDAYDNPLPEGTPLTMSTMIDRTMERRVSTMDNLIANDKIYASNRAGNGAVSISYEHVSSKEFRLDFYANDPLAFTLRLQRQHAYADGNQLVELSTNTIKDSNGNAIPNGTLVTFEISDHEGRKTIANAETINGIASLELPAPSYPTTWTTSATVQGYAISNEVRSSFKPSIIEIPISISTDELKVGPLKSFMNQHVREGLLVEIVLENENGLQAYMVPTKNGIASFHFREQLIRPGQYKAAIKVAGIKKSIKLTVPNE